MSKLLVIPSIDIKNGKTVRVVQGIPELHCDEYGNDPIEMAMLWRAENAKCIHIVDFNSSREHSHKNYEIIEEICNSVIIPVQLGGGIRTFDDVKSAVDMGIYRVVIGTMAYENPKEFKRVMDNFSPNKIVAAIDVVDGEVMVNGRTKKTGLDPVEYAKKLSDMGVARIIITDVKRNGMMTGPNIELSKRIGDVTGVKITLSGGIGGYKDLISVQDSPSKEIDSVIIGRALYENKFPCQKIWRVAEAGIFN